MTLRDSIIRDIDIAREALLNAKTIDETNVRLNWLRKCKQRLEEYDNDSKFRKNS